MNRTPILDRSFVQVVAQFIVTSYALGLIVAQSAEAADGAANLVAARGQENAMSSPSRSSGRGVEPTTNSIGMKLVPIPAGEFMMGAEEDRTAVLNQFPYADPKWLAGEAPRHHVRISKTFLMGQYEVTLGQFLTFYHASGYKLESERDGKPGWGYQNGRLVETSALRRPAAPLTSHPPTPSSAAAPSLRTPSPVPEVALDGTPPPAGALALIRGIPHVRQKPDFCGEACAEMVLSWLGRGGTQDDVFDVAGIDPSLGRGAITPELKRGLERLGFRVGEVWYPVEAARAAAELGRQFADLYADLVRGIPSIVCMHYDEGPHTTEHFRLVVGYDPATDEVVYHEPAEDDGAYRRMKRARMLRLWPLAYDAAHWTVIRFRLDLDPAAVRPPAQPLVHGHTPSEYAQHVLALKERLGPAFSVVLEPPYVVAGDEPEATVRAHAEDIVELGEGQPRGRLLHRGAEAHPQRLALQGRAQLPQEGNRALPRRAHDALRLLLVRARRAGDEHRHRRRHARPRRWSTPSSRSTSRRRPPGSTRAWARSSSRQTSATGTSSGAPTGASPPSRRRSPSTARRRSRRSSAPTRTPSTKRIPGPTTRPRATSATTCRSGGCWCASTAPSGRTTPKIPTGAATLRHVLGEGDLAAFQPKWEGYVAKLHFP